MKNICLNLTISICSFLFILFMLTEIGFIFGMSINGFYLTFSIISSVVLLTHLTLKDNKNNAIRLILAQFVILFDLVLLFGLLCYFIMDKSYDGVTYHQAMIILLKFGLNPIWDNVSNFANSQEYVFTSSIGHIETFLKFFEIIGANIYFVFNKIELTKLTNFIFCFCAFCYSFYTIRNYEFSKTKSFIFSFLIIYNPVCVCQMLSNYVDGAFYFTFLILLFACINFAKKTDTNKSLYLICISAVILSNIKLTGLFTTIVILTIFLLVYRSKKLLISSVIAFLLIIISGINPYITNIEQNRSPFYPIIKDSILKANNEGMITSYPPGFENKNRFEKFFFSLFAVSKNLSPLISSDDIPRLKIPLTIDGDDYFVYEDMRLAGFGYFFSGILLLSLILSIFIRFKNKEDKVLFWTVITILAISVFGNHEAWWARFIPQLWLLPIFLLLYLSEKNMIQINLILFICFINSLIINVQNFNYNIKNSIAANEQIMKYPKIMYIPSSYPEIYHTFQTMPIKLQEKGIKVIYTDN